MIDCVFKTFINNAFYIKKHKKFICEEKYKIRSSTYKENQSDNNDSIFDDKENFLDEDSIEKENSLNIICNYEDVILFINMFKKYLN